MASALEVFSLDGLGDAGDGSLLDEGDDGAAETTTGEAGAIDAGLGRGDLDEGVELGGAVLEILDGTAMGSKHELAKGCGIALTQMAEGGENTLVFAGDVKGAAANDMGHVGSEHLGGGGIAQGGDAEDAGSLEALGTALVVLASGEGVLYGGVDDEETDACGNGHGLDGLGTAIEEDGTAFFAKDGGNLVEQATTDADKVVLGLAAELGEIEAGQMKIIEPGEEDGGADLEGSGTGEAGAEGEGAGEIGLEPSHGITGLAKHAGDATRVVSPTFARGKSGEIGLDETGEALAGQDDFAIVTRAALGGDAQIDGGGEHDASVVIGVVAKELDPARGVGGD